MDDPKVIIPILIFLLGTLYSVYNVWKQRKLSLRAYPSIEEVYLPLDMSEFKIKENTKLYLIGDYSKLVKQYPETEIIYLKIINLGPGQMLNCSVNAKIITTDNEKSWDFSAHIPLIMKDESVFLPLATEDMEGEVILKNTIIKFITQTSEIMVYEQNMQSIDGNKTIIKEALYAWRYWWFFDKTIYKYEGKNSMFVYLNSRYNKTAEK